MKDAWKQYTDLVNSFTTETETRSDLKVRAIAHKRCVELSLGKLRIPPDDRYLDRYEWTTTQRNVSTMRELAEAIIAACDFVDEMNPEWAKHHFEGPIEIVTQ